MNPPDGLGQQDRDVNCLDLMALELLEVVGDGVGHNNLVYWRLFDEARGLFREDPVCSQGVDFVSATLLQNVFASP